MTNKVSIPRVVISLLSAPVSKLGGQEIRWGRLAKFMLEQPSLDVRVVANSSLVKCLRALGVNLEGWNLVVMPDQSSRLMHNLLAQWTLWKTVSCGTVIHVPAVGIRTIYTALLCKRLRGCRVVFSYTANTFRGYLDNPANIKGFKIVTQIAQYVDLFEVINPAIDWHGLVPKEKLRVAPCSFSDPVKFKPAELKTNKVVFAGHLSTAKGVYLLIDILRAWPRHDSTLFSICGDSDGSPSSQQAEQMIAELCHERPGWKRLRLVDVSTELSDAKVFLSLQEISNYPSQSLLEAMLCGCCVVATNTGETNLLVHEPYGALVRKGAPVSCFVNAIQNFLMMPYDQFKLRSDSARNFVLEHHTLEKYANHIVGLWRELAWVSGSGTSATTSSAKRS
jgi:glycosyltransferase involved in cell wall biosynthesis